MLLDQRRPAVFLPADPPREGRLALYREGETDRVVPLTTGQPLMTWRRHWRNRITCGAVQLRLGRDGQWCRLARSGTGWDLDAAPDPDPAALLAWADASTVTR